MFWILFQNASSHSCFRFLFSKMSFFFSFFFFFLGGGGGGAIFTRKRYQINCNLILALKKALSVNLTHKSIHWLSERMY